MKLSKNIHINVFLLYFDPVKCVENNGYEKVIHINCSFVDPDFGSVIGTKVTL